MQRTPLTQASALISDLFVRHVADTVGSDPCVGLIDVD